MVSDATQNSVLSLAESHSRELAARCRILFDVAELARTLGEAFRRTLASHHLTEIGLNVLAALSGCETATPHEVARCAGLPKGTTCHALAQLELAGLLVFLRDPEDPDHPRVQCTAQGRRLCAGTLRACLETVLQLTASLDAPQVDKALAALERMRGTNQAHFRP